MMQVNLVPSLNCTYFYLPSPAGSNPILITPLVVGRVIPVEFLQYCFIPRYSCPLLVNIDADSFILNNFSLIKKVYGTITGLICVSARQIIST